MKDKCSDGKAGGFGQCEYCGKSMPNISYHESRCDKNPINKEEATIVKPTRITDEMVKFATDNGDCPRPIASYHVAANLNSMLANGYCNKCGLVPQACECNLVPVPKKMSVIDELNKEDDDAFFALLDKLAADEDAAMEKAEEDVNPRPINIDYDAYKCDTLSFVEGDGVIKTFPVPVFPAPVFPSIPVLSDKPEGATDSISYKDLEAAGAACARAIFGEQKEAQPLPSWPLPSESEADRLRKTAKEIASDPIKAREFIQKVHDASGWTEELKKPLAVRKAEEAYLLWDYLVAKAREFNVLTVCGHILNNEDFLIASGSCINALGDNPRHHYGDHGLIKHTYEIISSGLKMIELYHEHEIDKVEFFMAALFHDYGKMWDYKRIKVAERVGASGIENEYAWFGTDHKRMIHHISRSAIEWMKASECLSDEMKAKYQIPVCHAILAHHGQRQFGSPVMPKTKVAYLLHTCDMMSARLNDCDSFDMVNFKKE